MAARRLRAPARRRCRAPGCCSSRTARRSSTRAWPRSATRCATPPFGELWVGGAAPDALRARLRLDPEPERRRPRRPRRPITSTSSSSTSSTTPRPRSLPSGCSTTSQPGRAARADRHAGAQRRPADPALVRRSHRRRAAAVGRDRPAPPRRRSPTTASTTASTCATSRGGAAGATTSTALTQPATPATTPGRAWSSQQVDAARRRPAPMRALGFCVSVEHARFMARVLQPARGIAAVARLGRQPRRRARSGARATSRPGGCSVVFSVDLFNEGVDVPARRHAADAAADRQPDAVPAAARPRTAPSRRTRRVCTVLDFVGTHRTEFRFDRRFRALLGGTRTDVERAVQSGFPFLPAGLPHGARPGRGRDRAAQPPRGDPVALAGEGRGAAVAARASDPDVGLARVPRGDRPRPRRRLRRREELVRPAGRRGARGRARRGRTRRRCDGRRSAAARRRRRADRRRTVACSARPQPPDLAALPERERRLAADARRLRSPTRRSPRSRRCRTASTCCGRTRRCGPSWPSCSDVLDDRVDHVPPPLRHAPGRAAAGPRPLHAHRDPGRVRRRRRPAKVAAVADRRLRGQAGQRRDLLAFTLDKTSGGFSPTTRYRDYAISRDLIHWESQSTTRADSETGLPLPAPRPRRHGRSCSSPAASRRPRLLVPRPRHLRRHVGEQPMAITWELDIPLPGDLFAAFAAAGVA